MSTQHHGTITAEYIDYNRRDVLATAELAIKLLEEYEKHPIKLQATKAYSPASIGKWYLKAMGIPPVLRRQQHFPKRYLGHAETAFYGGRTSAHIRKIAVPVVYTDFRSMYPTVNSLMDLWSFVTSREITVVDHCQAQVCEFLGRIKLDPDVLFDPATWKELRGFVQIIPDGDILPSRGKYNPATNDWQVAVNYLYANKDDATQKLWFSLPDVVASVLLTGRIPEIVDAFRIESNEKLAGLRTTWLRSTIQVNPTKQDFFRAVIEERQRLAGRTNLAKVEKDRLDKALKVLANASSYGIYAEMHRLESDKKVDVTCYGLDPKPFRCRVAHPDETGEFCFPPLASLITGAARLMLALLEHCVEKFGGTYAMEDTDSMAIVATERGGIVACPGGPHRTDTGEEAIKALSWEEVNKISARFADLNPYARDAVPGSILKIEDDNRDPQTGGPRQLYCFAISAKRYSLFVRDANGQPVLLRASCPYCGRKNKPHAKRCENQSCGKPIQLNNSEDRWSEHGLGHLMNPSDPESDDRDWIAQAWLGIVQRGLNLKTGALGFESSPALGRVTVSSPAIMRPLSKLNEAKKYPEQIKPFNFLLTCHVKALGHPPGADPTRFHLISPYETDSRKWLSKTWIDQYSGKQYRITTVGHHGDRHTARVKTYGDVLRDYEYHPEMKCADATGKPCGKQTIGLLQRRHVQIERIKYIGKESNSLEEVEEGLVHSEENVYTLYDDPRRDDWETKVVPAMNRVPLSDLQEKTKLSRRMLIDARTGKRRPHRTNQAKIAAALQIPMSAS